MRDRLLPLQNIIDPELWELISTLANQKDLPYILDKTFDTLEDSFTAPGYIGENNQIALCNMVRMFWDSCMYVSLDMRNAISLVDYTRMEQYNMAVAGKEIRWATAGEIASGARGLQMEYVYPVGEKAFRRLNILCWAVTGRTIYFKRLGYELKFSSDKKLETSFYQMINMCAMDLVDLFKWGNTENFEELYKELRKVKRKWKTRRCLERAEDEVIESITPKDLVFQLDALLPRGTSDPEYRRAVSIVIKAIRYETQPTPLEIELLRRVYDRVTKGDAIEEEEEKENKLKDECESLLEAKKQGLISYKHFAFRIIETISKQNYKRCSEKEYNIIKDALNLVEKEKKAREEQAEKEKAEAESAVHLDSVVDIMDSLGSGSLLED